MWPLRWPIWPGWWREESSQARHERSKGLRSEEKRRRGRHGRLVGAVRARLGGRRWHREGQVVVADAAAFLRGGLAERWEDEVGYVPAWVWTNRLAHGTEAELRAEAEWRAEAEGTRPVGGASGERWRRARAFLADEVLESAVRYGSLAALQRDVLVPLERELSGSAKASGYSLAEWVASVESALREASPHRASGRG